MLDMSVMLKEKLKLKTALRLIPACIFLIYIFSVMFNSYGDGLKALVENTRISELKELTGVFEAEAREEIHNKYDYINLNGLVSRVLDINTLNMVQKLEDGHLTSYTSEVDASVTAEKIISLNSFLSERGIDFVYLQMPCKYAFYDVKFPPGYESTLYRSYNELMSSLKDAGVDTIDMGTWFEEKDWSMDDTFFTTDHHWKPEAAMAAVRCTMDYLSRQGMAEYDSATLAEESWTVTEFEDAFLGSFGTRTGFIYAGVDDFPVYEPNFETDYNYTRLNKSGQWLYSSQLLNWEYVRRGDYYNNPMYETYMWGDFGLRTTVNDKGYNDRRLLLLGDSFKLPYEYFLTTQFREVYTIDTRYYSEGTVAQYVAQIQPDLVIACVSMIYSDVLFDYGVDAYRAGLEAAQGQESRTVALGDFAIAAQEDNDNNFAVLYANLEPGGAYTLSVDSAVNSDRDRPYIQLTLWNLSENKAICSRFFNANDREAQRWLFTTPQDNDQYAIYLYAGTAGKTENVAVGLQGAALQVGFPGD